MALTVTNSFEGGTNGTAITTGNSGGTSGTAFASVTKNAGVTFTFDNSHPAQGSSLGGTFTYPATSAGYAVMNFATTLGSRTSFRLWVYLPGTAVQYSPRMMEFRDSSSTLLAFTYVRSSDGFLLVGNGSGQSAISPSALPTDQLIFIEGAITTSGTSGAGICEVTAYAATDLVNPLWSVTKSSATLGSTLAINTIRLGRSDTGNSATFSIYYDDFGITDTLSSGFMGPVSPPPAPSFTFTPTTGNAPLAVTFTDTTTGTPTSWAWDFNDGGTSTSQNPSHTYTGYGTYTVKLTATNSIGTASTTQSITVLPSQLVNTFDGGTNSVSMLGESSGTGNTGFTSGTPFDIVLRAGGATISWSNSQVWNGSLSAQFNYPDSSAGYVAWNVTVPTATTRVTAKAYVYLGTIVSGSIGDGIISFYTSGGQAAQIAVSASNGYLVTPTGSAYTPPKNTWLRIEAGCKPGTTTSNGTFDWAVYVGDSLTAATSGSASNLNLGTAAITQVRFGATAGAGVRTDYYDNLAVTTTLTTGFIGVVTAPVAAYTVSSTSGTLPMTTTFTDTSTNTPVVWYWDFGDGTTSTSTSPTHTYTANGTYTVSQTAINSNGGSNSTNVNQITAVGTITVYNTFEGGTSAASVTTGNSGGISGTAFTSIASSGSATLTYSTNSPAQASTMGMKVSYPGASSAGYAVMTIGASLGSRVSFRLWGGVASATIATRPRFLEFRDSSNQIMGYLNFQNDGTIYLGDNAGAGGAFSVGAAPLDQLFFMQGALTTGATTGTAKWEFVGFSPNDLSTPLWSTVATNATTQSSTLALGSIRLGSSAQSTGANDVFFDDFLATDTLITGFPPPRIPQITIPYTETWTGTNGTAWPAKWVPRTSAGTGGSAVIQSNAGRMTVGTTSTSWMKAFLPAIPAMTDTDLLVSFTIASQVVSNFNFQINADATQLSVNTGEMPQNGYTVNFNVDTTATNGSYDTWRMSGNAYTQFASTTGITLTAGTKYTIRFQRYGSLVRFRLWAASGAEPSTWTYSATDSTPLGSGRVAMAVGNAVGQIIDYDDLTVSVPSQGKLMVYSGSAFSLKPVKIWSGSWKIKPVKWWNGTTWLITNMITTTTTLTTSGSSLQVGGTTKRLAGANAYWLGLDDNNGGTYGTFPTHKQITAAFTGMVEMGMNLVRAHTVGISAGTPNSFETAAGVYNSANLDSADWAVYQAKLAGIYLMVPLTDNWNYYHGGKWNFVHWAYQQNPSGITDTPGTTKDDSNERIFFANTAPGLRVRALFKDYIYNWLNHVNPYTGLAYKDDPTIAIIETGNEIYYASQIGSNEWTQDICSYVKSIAPNKLLADGSASTNIPVSTMAGLTAAACDIVGSHYYVATPTYSGPVGFTVTPSNYGTSISALQALQTDVTSATGASKVFILGEYPWTRSDVSTWYNTIEHNSSIAGSLFWTNIPNTDAGVAETHGGAFGTDDYPVHRPYSGTSEQAYAPALARHISTLTGIANTNSAGTAGVPNLISSTALRTASNASLFTIGSGSIATDATQAMEGGSSVKVTPSGTGVYPYWYFTTPSNGAPATPSLQYTGVASVRTTTSGSFGFQAALLWYKSDGTYISTSTGSAVSPIQNSWVQYSITATAPALTGYAVVQVQASSPMNAADVFNVDEYGIFAGTVISWTS